MKFCACTQHRWQILLCALLMLVGGNRAFAEVQTDARQQVNWKLFFNQIFAAEIRREMRAQNASQAEIRDALREYIAYTPLGFSETIQRVTSVKTSAEAYQMRLQIYDDKGNADSISRLDFSASIPAAYRNLPEVRQLLQDINNHKDRLPAANENFFLSPEGQALMRAMSVGATGTQEVAFILVPGYAAHVIKFGIFPEIVAQANRLHQRPDERPLLDEGSGFDLRYENYKEFYSRGSSGQYPFDILSPAGMEMGNTVGKNAETADLLARWIAGLPAHYRQRKLILLGYSKGAPIVLELLQRHPELKQQVIGVVTYGGVVQGTHVARMGKETIDAILGAHTIGEVIDKVRPRGTSETLRGLLPFLAPFDLSFTQTDNLKKVLDVYGVNVGDLDKKIDRVLNGREVRELVDGIVDMSPYTRTSWNLRYLDSNLVQPETFFMNMSAVTNIADFASNRVTTTQKNRSNSLLAPIMDGAGKINWRGFSLDAWFLYLSSIEGFKMAPGGLYDTQVDLQHTKSPWLDTSPLSLSLTEQEISALWSQADLRRKLVANGIDTIEELKTTPRHRLLKGEVMQNLRSIDLGEFKGHHWSLFHQAFRPSKEQSETFAVWEFPREPFIKAVMYTMALYLAGNRAG